MILFQSTILLFLSLFLFFVSSINYSSLNSNGVILDNTTDKISIITIDDNGLHHSSNNILISVSIQQSISPNIRINQA